MLREFIRYYLIYYDVLLSKLLLLALLLIIALMLGLKILRLLRIGFEDNDEKKELTLLETFLFASGIGFGLISLITLILGMYFSLNKSTIIIIAVIIILASIKSLYTYLKTIFSCLKEKVIINRYHLIILFIILLCLFSNVYTSLFPPTEWDELMYHLTAPKRYVEENHIYYTPEIIYSYMPLNTEMLYTLGMLFDSDIAARLIHNLFTLFAALSIFAFSRRFFCKNTAYIALFIFYTLPIVGYLAPIAYIDFGLTFYVFLSVYAFVIWFRSDRIKWLVLSALLLGFALGTKHTALIVLLLMMIAIVQKALVDRKGTKFIIFSEIALICISIFVVYLWYYRAFIYTGNPIFPFLTRIFGGGEYFTTQDAFVVVQNSLRNYDGVGRSLIKFLLLPITLTIFPKEFHGNMGIFILVFSLPLIFIKNVSKIIKSFLFYSVLFLFIWFITSQQMRFILPVLALLSIISAYCLVKINGWSDPDPQSRTDKAYDLRFNLKKYRDWIRFFSIFIIIIGTLLHLMAYDSFFNLLRNVPHSHSQRVDFYNKHIRSFPTINFANAYLPENAVVYTYWDASKKYLYKNKVIGDLFGYGAFFKLDLTKTKETKDKLWDLGVTHIVINSNRPESKVNWDYWQNHLKPIYEQNNVALYEVSY